MAYSSERLRETRHWVYLGAATAALWTILTVVGAPSAALFASLTTAIVLALVGVAPKGVPRWASSLSQAALGVVIGSMVHADTLRSLGSAWLPAVAVGLVAPRPAGAEVRRTRLQAALAFRSERNCTGSPSVGIGPVP